MQYFYLVLSFSSPSPCFFNQRHADQAYHCENTEFTNPLKLLELTHYELSISLFIYIFDLFEIKTLNIFSKKEGLHILYYTVWFWTTVKGTLGILDQVDLAPM